MSQVINTTAADFKKDVLDSALPVLVDFWAPWCGPCRAMAPILDEIADEQADKLKVVKLDVNNPEHISLAQQYGVQGIPNMQLFRSGKVEKEVVGMREKEDLLAELGF